MASSAAQKKKPTQQARSAGKTASSEDPMPEEAPQRLPKFQQRGMGVSLLRMAVGLALLYCVVEITAKKSVKKQRRITLEKLGPLSLPSTAKYHQVLRDEKLRAQVNSAKRSKKEEAEYQLGYKNNQFNQYISDRMSLHRRAYDTRDVGCLEKKYYPVSELPTTTVIIIFYNEARSTLLRTVWSVLDRSPKRLIKEILLVDDGSSMEHLKYDLDREVKSIPKTRVIHLPERMGLIQAKVKGAEAAVGDVLLYLDSHCECNDGWLEPLLDRVRRDRRTVAMPIIDAIAYEDWEWRTGVLERGVLDWTQRFYWMPLTPEVLADRTDKNAVFHSPAMAGGLFAIDRKYFFEIGAYDMGMETWGGENIEMSFRVWMCGGKLEAVPCSHVAHVFRQKTPYKFKTEDPQATIAYNLNRVAEVWMDKYADIYYAMKPGNRKYGYGNITERVEWRKNHKCKSFKWYLDNVFSDFEVPHDIQVHNGKNWPLLSCPVDDRPFWKR